MRRVARYAFFVVLGGCGPRAGAGRASAPGSSAAPHAKAEPAVAAGPIDLQAARTAARRKVEALLAKNPAHAAARIDMGRLLVDDAERLRTPKAFAAAEAWVRADLERRPGHPLCLMLLARLALARGEVDLAMLMATEAARALAGEPLPAELLVLLGRIRLRHGDGNEALRAFVAAIAADPSFGEAHARAALVLISMRDYAEGLHALDRAQTHDPRLVDHPQLLRARAAAHLGLRDLAKARQAAERAAVVDLDHPRTRLLRAELRLHAQAEEPGGDSALLASRDDLAWVVAHTTDVPELASLRERAATRLHEIDDLLKDAHADARKIAAQQAAERERLERARRAADRPRLLRLEREARAAHEAYARTLEAPQP